MLGKRWRVLTTFLVIVMVITSLFGCTPAGDGDEPTEPDQPTEAPTEPPDEPDVPDDTDGSTVTILSMEDPPSFNHWITDTGYENLVAELVLLGMADIGPNGEIFPELATELPSIENGMVVVDEEEWTMEVTWTMRQDIFWEDGEPVTADDVIFTWNALTDPETGMWVPGVDYTDSVEKIDDYTFVVYYSYVYPDYLEQFGGFYGAIWPEHYCSGDGIANWDCNMDPLSDGPYLLEEWVAGDHLTFVRNPDYYEEGKPSVDRIFIRIVPEETVRQEMMLEGDADIDFWIIQNVMRAYETSPNVEVSQATFGRWFIRLWPNLAARGTISPTLTPHPVFSDVRVRQAMRMAINSNEIVEAIWGTGGTVTPMWTEFYREPYTCDEPQPEFDPAGAATLLEDAGWTDTNGDGIRECHGCETGAPEGYEMSVEFLVYSEWGETLELAHQLIAEDLNDMGMATDLGLIEGSILWDTYDAGGVEQNGNFDLNLWDDGYAGNQITDYLWLYYYSAAAFPDYGWNVERWFNDDFDYLLDETYSLDEEYRQELFCQMAEILADEVPNIPFAVSVEALGYNARLANVIDNGNDMPTWNAADWQIVE